MARSRVAQQLLAVRAVAVEGQPDADRCLHHSPVSHEHRLTGGHQDALDQTDHLVTVGEVLEDDPELVATEASGTVRLAEAASQRLGRGLEQRVTGRVPERVVDELEVVEVDEQHGETTAVALDPGHRLLEPVLEEGPVAEPGERVVVRLVGEALLELPTVGDVPEAPDPADDDPVDPLRPREPLEGATVDAFEDVAPFELGATRVAELGGEVDW